MGVDGGGSLGCASGPRTPERRRAVASADSPAVEAPVSPELARGSPSKAGLVLKPAREPEPAPEPEPEQSLQALAAEQERQERRRAELKAQLAQVLGSPQAAAAASSAVGSQPPPRAATPEPGMEERIRRMQEEWRREREQWAEISEAAVEEAARATAVEAESMLAAWRGAANRGAREAEQEMRQALARTDAEHAAQLELLSSELSAEQVEVATLKAHAVESAEETRRQQAELKQQAERDATALQSANARLQDELKAQIQSLSDEKQRADRRPRAS